MTVKKVVTGPATAGTTVEVVCEEVGGDPFPIDELSFDATGTATTLNGTEPWEIEDGAWVLASADGLGCGAASGSGVGPVTVVAGAVTDETGAERCPGASVVTDARARVPRPGAVRPR